MLEDRGGWFNREVVEWFPGFADLCFTEFGPVVKLWMTLNEPRETGVSGYGQSIAQGFNQSRLPAFTSKESALVLGSSNFLGLNIYTAYLTYEDQGLDEVSYLCDSDTASEYSDSWVPSVSDWLDMAPFGLWWGLAWVARHYGPGPLYVTENGFSDFFGNTDDLGRIYYLKHYINQLLKAVTLDNSKLGGYFAWSLLDNMLLDTMKSGLNSLNFADPSRTRTANGFQDDGDICLHQIISCLTF